MARRGGYAKGALSKETILNAAVELFGRNGYTATSLRDVARHSGLTHSGLLHHFPNKGALLAAVLERKDREDHERITQQKERGDLTVHNFLAMAVENQKHPEIIRLFAMLSVEATNPAHPANQYFVERYRIMHHTATAMIHGAKEAGAMRADLNPDLAARMVTALMDGLQIQWLLEEETGEVNVEMSAVLEEFMRFLEVAPATDHH